VAVITRVEDVALLRIPVRKEKEIVMDQVMEVVMMDIKDVKGIFNVEAIIAGNLVYTSTKKMIAVKSPQPTPKHLNLKLTSLEHPWNQKKVKDAGGAILSQADIVALQRTHVMKVKETVMVLMMVANMMVMQDVRGPLFVVQTTVKSLVHIITRKMIAVRVLFPL